MVDVLETQEELLSTPEAAKAAGVTIRQILYWADGQHLEPRGLRGSGHNFMWPQDQIEKASLIKKFLDMGFMLQMAVFLSDSREYREKLGKELIELSN